MSDDRDRDKPISMQMTGQSWSQAVKDALQSRLGVQPDLQEKYFTMDDASYKFTEEVADSRSFPKLKTVYLVNAVTVYITDTKTSDLYFLGLPDGNDFTFSRLDRQSSLVGRELSMVREKVSMPSTPSVVLVFFGWNPVEMEMTRSKKPKRTVPTFTDTATAGIQRAVVPKRQVPPPEPLFPTNHTTTPLLNSLLKNQRTDWSRAKRAATRICDENYSCKAFHDDVVGAFPELRLYVSANETSSGRASSDEFQRTVGALYAIYWLMRGHLDGIDCFTYGLRSDMINARKDLTEFPEHGEFDKRHTFRKENDWARLE